MKKRLISLLVALCMAVTLLPVSAITAWAEGGGQLKIEGGYPVGSGKNHDENCSGDGWSYDGSTQTLTLDPSTPTTYDLKECGNIRQDQRSISCSAIIGQNATIINGIFWDHDNPGPSITNYGTITSGRYLMPVINHGTIIDGVYGVFNSAVSNESDGTIENGTFISNVTNNGIINGGIFSEKPDGNKVAAGYTLNVESPDSTTEAGIRYFNSSCYIIPHSSYTASITVLYRNPPDLQQFPIDVTFGDTNNTHCLLEDWAPSASYRYWGDEFSVTFTAPPAKADTVTLSKLTRLVIDKAGYPVGTEGGTQDYSGNGWKFENGTLTLESGSYDFSGEENALRPLNPNVHLVVESGAKLTGGAFKNEPTGEGAGTFRKVTLNGTGSITAVNGLASDDWGNTLYVVPNVVPTGANTITASVPIRDINLKAIYGDDVAKLYPNQSDLSTILLNVGWLEYQGYIKENTNIVLNQGTYSTLKMADDGTPITTGLARISDGNFHTYFGNGWHSQALSGDPDNVYLESGNYNFLYTDPVNKKGENLRSVNCGIVNEGGIIEDGIFNTLVANGQPGSTSSKPHEIEGGTFAAGLLYNDGVITGGAFNGKDSIFTNGTVLSGNYRSVTVNGGAIVRVNDTLPLIYDETAYNWIPGLAWDLYS